MVYDSNEPHVSKLPDAGSLNSPMLPTAFPPNRDGNGDPQSPIEFIRRGGAVVGDPMGIIHQRQPIPEVNVGAGILEALKSGLECRPVASKITITIGAKVPTTVHPEHIISPAQLCNFYKELAKVELVIGSILSVEQKPGDDQWLIYYIGTGYGIARTKTTDLNLIAEKIDWGDGDSSVAPMDMIFKKMKL